MVIKKQLNVLSLILIILLTLHGFMVPGTVYALDKKNTQKFTFIVSLGVVAAGVSFLARLDRKKHGVENVSFSKKIRYKNKGIAPVLLSQEKKDSLCVKWGSERCVGGRITD